MEIAEAQTDELSRRMSVFSDALFARLPVESAANFPPDRRRSIAAEAYEFFSVRTEALMVRVL
ncbi:MAG TPA: hypothetical protein VJ718_01380, partial [Candidatus Binataceae bacterium]|nr:hypothetical protein [Candidatus Binataceae bacterium]